MSLREATQVAKPSDSTDWIWHNDKQIPQWIRKEQGNKLGGGIHSICIPTRHFQPTFLSCSYDATFSIKNNACRRAIFADFAESLDALMNNPNPKVLGAK